MLRKTLQNILIIAVTPALCLATSFGGEWNNAVYISQNRIDTLIAPASVYENINLQLINIGGSKISAYTNIYGTNRFIHSPHKSIEASLLYIDWREIASIIDLRLGRQANFERYHPFYFDGIKLGARFTESLSLSGYAGVQVPYRYDQSYFQIKADTTLYDGGIKLRGHFGGTDIGLLYDHESNSKTIIRQDIGINLAQTINQSLSCNGDALYGIPDKKLTRYRLHLDVDPTTNLSIAGGLLGNFETSDTADIFSVNIFKNYQQINLDGIYTINKNSSISAGYLVRIISDNELNHEVEGRLQSELLSFGIVQDFGYGGYNTQLDAAVRFFSSQPVQVEAGFSGMRYSITGLTSDALFALMGRLALDFKPAITWFNAHLEVQYLNNRYYQYDTRVLLSTQLRFSTFTAQ